MTTKRKTKAAKKTKKLGRPTKLVGRKISREEIARELIEGIVVLDEQNREMRRVPTLREIARRLDVSHSHIGKIAHSHDCARRHEQYRKAHPEPFEAYDRFDARQRAKAKVDAKQDAREAAALEAESKPKKRKPGRPSRLDSPHIPWNEVDRLLVLGEAVEMPDGTQSTVYPPLRELARRYGIAHSAIVKYWQEHHCERRRETARQRLLDKTEEKLLELRAATIAVSKDDALRIIDKYLTKFEQALDEDRVRYDAPADFNTMLRLKEFVMGGPDSRQETTTTFTLEMLQERHARMLRETRQLSSAEMGVIDAAGHEVAGALDNSPNESTGETTESDAPDANSVDGGEPPRDESIDAATALHPPTRPFGRAAGQQTGNQELLATEAES